MSSATGGTAILLVGALLVRLTVTDAYQRYVRVGMGPWLLTAGVLLVALGLAAVAAALRRPVSDHEHGDEHAHVHVGGERIGWLLLAPVVALLLVAPPALGSFGVDRSSAVTVGTGGSTFGALPAGGGARSMTLLEFDQRAFDRAGASFGTSVVQLTGFVARSQDGEGFRLARYQIACCAADAVAAVVRVSGVTGTAPARDAWYSIVGTFRRVGKDGVPELAATSAQPVPAPIDPYE